MAAASLLDLEAARSPVAMAAAASLLDLEAAGSPVAEAAAFLLDAVVSL
jgi:hypothetical protein